MSFLAKINTLKKENGDFAGRFFWMAWTGAVGIANSMLVWVFMARFRDVDEFGRFAIVMGLYALFFTVVSLGLLPYLVNEITRRSANDSPDSEAIFLSSASVLLAISGVVCTIAMTAGGFLVSSSADVRLGTFILSLSMFPSALIMIAEAKAIAAGKTRMLAAVTTMESVLRTVIPIALLWQGFGLVAVCASFAVIRFIAMIAFGIIGREQLRVFRFCRREMMAIVRVAPTFAGTVVLSSINWQAPIFLLAYIGTESETAEFGAASRFLIPVSILLASYANVIQPEIASRIHNGMIDSGKFLLRAVSYPAAIAAVGAIVTVVVSERVLTLLFGAEYASASISLDVLAFSVIPFCAVMVISRALIATRSQRVDLIANFIGLSACLVSGSFLAPAYGATGAAVAQMVSFIVMVAIVGLFIYRKLRGVATERSGAITAEAV